MGFKKYYENEEIKKKKELNRYHKMYIKFCGNYLEKDSSDFYKTFHNSERKIHDNGFLEGLNIDISNIYKSEMIDILNIRTYINCFEMCNNLIFIGTKNSDEPFDIFDFKYNKSEIQIYDNEMNYINKWTTEEGYAIQIHVDYFNDVYNCIVLFHSGKLVKFKYYNKNFVKNVNNSNKNNRDEKIKVNIKKNKGIDLNNENKKIINNSISNEIYDIEIIEKDMKVIKFNKEIDYLVYTDGFKVKLINKDQSIMNSGIFTSLIIDLLCICVENKIIIVFVDINGKHYYCNNVFDEFKLIGYYPGFYRLKLTDKNIIISSDGIGFRKIYNFFKKEKKAVKEFIAYENGSVGIIRFFNDVTRSKCIFQGVSKKEGILFLFSENEFKLFKNEQLHLTGIKKLKNYCVIAMENGLIIKLKYF